MEIERMNRPMKIGHTFILRSPTYASEREVAAALQPHLPHFHVTLDAERRGWGRVEFNEFQGQQGQQVVGRYRTNRGMMVVKPYVTSYYQQPVIPSATRADPPAAPVIPSAPPADRPAAPADPPAAPADPPAAPADPPASPVIQPPAPAKPRPTTAILSMVFGLLVGWAVGGNVDSAAVMNFVSVIKTYISAYGQQSSPTECNSLY